MQLAIAFIFWTGHFSKMKKKKKCCCMDQPCWTWPKNENSLWGQSSIVPAWAGRTDRLSSLWLWRFSGWQSPNQTGLKSVLTLLRVGCGTQHFYDSALRYNFRKWSRNSSHQIFPLVTPFPHLRFISVKFQGSFTRVTTPNLSIPASFLRNPEPGVL